MAQRSTVPTWRKVQTDWEPWCRHSLAEVDVERLIRGGTASSADFPSSSSIRSERNRNDLEHATRGRPGGISSPKEVALLEFVSAFIAQRSQSPLNEARPPIPVVNAAHAGA